MRLSLAALVFCPLVAHGQICKTVDAAGNVYYGAVGAGSGCPDGAKQLPIIPPSPTAAHTKADWERRRREVDQREAQRNASDDALWRSVQGEYQARKDAEVAASKKIAAERAAAEQKAREAAIRDRSMVCTTQSLHIGSGLSTSTAVCN